MDGDLRNEKPYTREPRSSTPSTHPHTPPLRAHAKSDVRKLAEPNDRETASKKARLFFAKEERRNLGHQVRRKEVWSWGHPKKCAHG